MILHFFIIKKSELFFIDELDERIIDFVDTRNRKKRLKLNETIKVECDTLELNDINNIFELTKENLEQHNNDFNQIYESDKKHNKSEENTVSTCSSRTSHTHSSSTSISVESDEENSNDSSYSSLSDIAVNCTIPEFPVQIISLEKMSNTLDSLLGDDITSDEEEDFEDLSNDEWQFLFISNNNDISNLSKMF